MRSTRPAHQRRFRRGFSERLGTDFRAGFSGRLRYHQLACRWHYQGGLDRYDKLVAAFRGLRVEGPFGPFNSAANDHQATLGAYVGKITLKDGGDDVRLQICRRRERGCRSDEEVKKLRPAAAMN